MLAYGVGKICAVDGYGLLSVCVLCGELSWNVTLGHAGIVLYFHLWPLRLCNIFPYYLIKGTTLKKKIIEHKLFILFSCKSFFLKHFSF
jgi:hypothetical protein